MATQKTVQEPTDESLYRRLIRLDSQIKIEFDLIGFRVSWLLLSNSFLFTAYVVALNNPCESILKKNLIESLVWSLPAIGLASSLLVTMAILAANSVIKELKKLRSEVEDKAWKLYQYERLGVDLKSWPHIVGNGPPNLLPPLLFIVWAILLYIKIKGVSHLLHKIIV